MGNLQIGNRYWENFQIGSRKQLKSVIDMVPLGHCRLLSISIVERV